MTARDDRELRRRRAAVARVHHPDLGGNAADLVAEWQALDEAARAEATTGSAAPGRSGAAGPEVRFVRRPTGAGRWLSWLTSSRAARHLRRRRPPRLPRPSL